MIHIDLTNDIAEILLRILNRATQDGNLKINNQEEYLACMQLANLIVLENEKRH